MSAVVKDNQRERAARQHQDTQQQGQEGGVQQGLEQTTRQEIAYLFGLLHVARHHACRGGFKHRQRQRKQMCEATGAHHGIHLTTGNLHQTLARIGKAGVESSKQDEDGNDGGEGVPRLMGNDAVDQDLKQQGQCEGDQVAGQDG